MSVEGQAERPENDVRMQWDCHYLYPVTQNTLMTTNVLLHKIQKMNQTFNLECNPAPINIGVDRLRKFQDKFLEECEELDDVYNDEGDVDLVALADCFGDLLTYLLSECCRWGIPILNVFADIDRSQESKLVNGKPLFSEDGAKFIKGPDYRPPEDDIEQTLAGTVQRVQEARDYYKRRNIDASSGS